MNVTCPNCNEPVEQVRAPKRWPVNDGSEMWLCLKCPTTVCIHCYHDHTGKEHPNMYEKQPSGGNKKNQKGKRR